MEAVRQRSDRNKPPARLGWGGAKRRPAIGVSMGHADFGSRATDATEKAYAQAVVSAGSIPLLIPALSAVPPEEVIARLDGLVLTGGGDVDPRRYGAVPSPLSGGTMRNEMHSKSVWSDEQWKPGSRPWPSVGGARC